MTEHGQAHVLLVEDNPADARLFREAITRHASDIHLQVVDNGDDALRFVRREGNFASSPNPDLIILDFNLPGKDGREVLRELKSDPVLKRIPVVVLTTAGSETDVLRAYELHANCYIRKPVDMDEFIRAVNAFEVFWLEVARLPTR
jgi:CheY-like chemotaxis protein